MGLSLAEVTQKLNYNSKLYNNSFEHWEKFKETVKRTVNDFKIRDMTFSENASDQKMAFYISIFSSSIKCSFLFHPENGNKIQYSIKTILQPNTCFREETDRCIDFNHDGNVHLITYDQPEGKDYPIYSVTVVAEHLEDVMALIGIN